MTSVLHYRPSRKVWAVSLQIGRATLARVFDHLPRRGKPSGETAIPGRRRGRLARRTILSALIVASTGYVAPGVITGHPELAHADSGYVYVSPTLNLLTGQQLGNVVLATTEFIPSFNVLGAPNPQVNWGDGTPTDYLQSNQVACNSNGLEINCPLVDPHSYQNPGTYNITVTYNTGAAIWYTTNIVAVVNVPSPTAVFPSANEIAPIEGTAFTGTAAVFEDDNTTDQASAFQATLNWGDGTPTVAGTVTGALAFFGVGGTHTYAQAGTYQIDAKVMYQGGATDVYAMARVGDAPLSGTGTSFNATAGTAFTGNIGGFLDTGLAAPAGQYKISVDWGDQTSLDTTSATLSPTGVAEGPKKRGGDSSPGSAATPVTDPTSPGSPATPVPDPSSPGSAATPVPAPTAPGSVATPAPAPAPPPTSNAWNISGTHTYATSGTYTVTTTITDLAGGATTTAVTTANVVAATPTSTPVPPTATPVPPTATPTPVPTTGQGNGQVIVLDSGANSCNLNLQGGTINATSLAVNGAGANAACLNGGSLAASTITVQGGLQNQGATYQTGNLITGQQTADPLAGLTAPSVPSADCPGAACPEGANFNSGQTYNLLPGYYNGWLNFNSGSLICLAPGAYYVDGGWNLNTELFPYGSKACPAVPAGASDAGVTLYFHTGSLQVNNGGSTLLLSAPQSGPYAGILYWQADGTGLYPNGKVGGNGAWYAPNAQVVLNSGVTFTANQVIVKDLTVNSNATLTAPTGAMTTGYTLGRNATATATATSTPTTGWSIVPNSPAPTSTPTTGWSIVPNSPAPTSTPTPGWSITPNNGGN